jgi:hypothetical protein
MPLLIACLSMVKNVRPSNLLILMETQANLGPKVPLMIKKIQKSLRTLVLVLMIKNLRRMKRSTKSKHQKRLMLIKRLKTVIKRKKHPTLVETSKESKVKILVLNLRKSLHLLVLTGISSRFINGQMLLIHW